MQSFNPSRFSAPARVAQLFLFVIVALLCAGMLSGCATSAVHSKPGTATTVIMLRHADVEEKTPLLSEAGHARARALVDAVKGMPITAIYSPDLQRNIDTVTPLARERGLEITLTPLVSVLVAKDIAQEMVTKHAGGTVVYVGNASGNLQSVYWHLGGSGTGPVSYGDLYIMSVPDKGEAKVVKKRFGY